MRARNECAAAPVCACRAGLAVLGRLRRGSRRPHDQHLAQRQPGGVPARRGRDFYRRSPHRALRRVFDADRSIVAVSSPLWSADESRAIFTTARDAPPTGSEAALEKKVGRPPVSSAGNPSASPARNPGGRESAASPVDWNDAPAGRFFLPLPVVYTCWQIERAADGSFKKPIALSKRTPDMPAMSRATGPCDSLQREKKFSSSITKRRRGTPSGRSTSSRRRNRACFRRPELPRPALCWRISRRTARASPARPGATWAD